MYEKSKGRGFILLLAVMPFLWGLFYEFTVFICACLLLLGIGIIVKKRKKFVFFKTYTNIAFVIFTAGYWVSICFAIDKGLAFVGALKFTAPLIFLVFLMQIEGDRHEECVKAIPKVGIIMLIISGMAGIFEESRDYFFRAGRLGGFFQYSNTMALFFLIGIILLCFEEKKNKKIWTEVILLVAGILLTGSRTVFFMMLAFFLFMCVREKNMRKNIIRLLGIVLIVTSIYVWVTGDYQNIGRYLSSSLESSTLLGRILYNIDGLRLLCEHLGGVGYKGYSILQPLIQTGVYTTVFVHNDWLQIALDAGVVTAIAFGVAVVGNIISKDTKARNKVVLIVISFHMLLDFDLQYLVIFGVLLLMFSLEHGKKEWKFPKAAFSIIPVCVLYGYFAIAYLFYHVGLYEETDKLYPYDSRIKEVCMMNSSNMSEAEDMADEILKLNQYSYAAWNIKAVAELEKENYAGMIECKKKGLAITRYDILEYQDYIVMLNKAINVSTGSEREKYISNLLCVENQIQEVLGQTNDLAYRIKDKPEMKLSQEYEDFIEFYREERKEKE